MMPPIIRKSSTDLSCAIACIRRLVTLNQGQAESLQMSTHRRSRPLRRIIRSAIVIYFLVCVFVFFIQDQMIFPGAASQGAADTRFVAEPGCEVLRLTTSGGDQVAALFGTALDWPDTKPRPTLLYFYGNGASVAWSTDLFEHFRRLGADVLVPDYVGYGMSTGKPSEAALYATADAAYDYLVDQRHVPPADIVAVGWSMGGAVAIDLASRRPVGALAVFNTFTSLREMARKTIPWLPTSLFLKYRFDNLQKIATINRPIFICNGLQDTLIPPSMSDRLAAAAKGPVTRLKIPAADHNEIFTADPQTVFSAFTTFLINAGPYH